MWVKSVSFANSRTGSFHLALRVVAKSNGKTFKQFQTRKLWFTKHLRQMNMSDGKWPFYMLDVYLKYRIIRQRIHFPGGHKTVSLQSFRKESFCTYLKHLN